MTTTIRFVAISCCILFYSLPTAIKRHCLIVCCREKENNDHNKENNNVNSQYPVLTLDCTEPFSFITYLLSHFLHLRKLWTCIIKYTWILCCQVLLDTISCNGSIVYGCLHRQLSMYLACLAGHLCAFQFFKIISKIMMKMLLTKSLRSIKFIKLISLR